MAAALNSLYPGARKLAFAAIAVLVLCALATSAYFFSELTGIQAFVAKDAELKKSTASEPPSPDQTDSKPAATAPASSEDTAADAAPAAASGHPAAANGDITQISDKGPDAAHETMEPPLPARTQATSAEATATAVSPTPRAGAGSAASKPANTDAGTRPPPPARTVPLKVLGVDYLMDGTGPETVCVRLTRKYVPNLHPLEGRVFFNLFGVEHFDGFPPPTRTDGVVANVRAHLHTDKQKLTVVLDLAPGAQAVYSKRFEPDSNRFCATATPK